MRSHEDLDAWKAAMELAKLVYAMTNDWPDDERFGLINQIRRAVVSVPSNISEGAARSSDKDFAHFLDIALGSLAEVDTQFQLAQEFGYTVDTAICDQITTVRKLTLGLRKHIRSRIQK